MNYRDLHVARASSLTNLDGNVFDLTAVFNNGGTISTTLSGLQTSTGGKCMTCKSVADPLFVSKNGDDYHLTTASPARQTGLHLSPIFSYYLALHNVGIAIDTDRLPRPSAGEEWDAGAYQYA